MCDSTDTNFKYNCPTDNTAAPNDPNSPPKKASKRACDSCNVRKIFCDGRQPCESCIRARINCTFLKTHLRPGPRKPRVKTFQLINSSQIDWKLGQGRGRKRRRSGSSEDDGNSTPGGGNDTLSSTGAKLRSENTEAKKCRIPLKVILHYLDIYAQRLYYVWPVLSVQLIKERLRNEKDLEAYALGIALAAAVIGQLRLECVFGLEDSEGMVTAVTMANEALRLRSLFPYRERFTAENIMTSFFLHIHYINRHGKSKSSFICLREAIAFAQAMKLDREATYNDMKRDEGEAKRKLFWLLFITDVSYSIQHGFPNTLDMTINYPTVDEDNEPVLCGFMNLILLFARLFKHKAVIDSWVYQEKKACSLESLKHLQFELCESFPFQIPSNEIQRADVLATRHWMRLVAWNVSMRHGFLSSDSSDVSMALWFPAMIAEDMVEVLAGLPRSAIDAHGNTMELKLFEITNSLGDLLIHAPLLLETTSWKNGPRESFLQLLDHMVQFRNINESLLSIILEKGEKIGVPLPPRRTSVYESDDSKSEFRFVHELTEEAARDLRRARESKSSRSKSLRAGSVDSSDRTDSSMTSERLILTGRKSSIFDDEYTIVATTAQSCSPLRNPIVNEYFDPFSAPPHSDML